MARRRNQDYRETARAAFDAGHRFTVSQLAAHCGCHYNTALDIIADLSPPHYPLTEERAAPTGRRGPRPTVYFKAHDTVTE